jgi:hypothetical protein
VRRRKGDRSDLQRLKILFASAERFWSGGNRVLIITPDVDDVRAEIDRLHPRMLVDVVHDDSVIKLDPRLNSWFKQQILKLAASQWIADDFYLVLDADCFFVAPTRRKDLILEGRGRVHFGSGNAYSHACWYRGCKRLGLPVPTKAVNVTPFVMGRDLASNALAFIRERPESIRKLGWSEYTVYQSLAERDGLWDRYHCETGSFLRNAVWAREELATWDAGACFDGRDPGAHLSLVQSNTGVSAAWVWDRVGQYLMK